MAHEDPGRPTGIWVIDTEQLAVIDRWEPIADFISLRLSADGTVVYAAGVPMAGANGEPAPSVEASVTGYDASDGTVRVIAGTLGRDWIYFDPRHVD
jgi:hypothetical protein